MVGWRYHTDTGTDHTVHVWPEHDAIDHHTDEPCICQPRLEEQDNGRVLVVHHSLDGCELSEPRSWS